MVLRPPAVGPEQEGEIQKLGAQFAGQAGSFGPLAQLAGCDLVLLQFAEQPAELPGETGPAGAALK